jgi:hypothetical protein
MKKHVALGLLSIALLALGVTGCQTTTSVVPQASIPLNRANYTILGETTAESTGTVFLIFYTGNNTEFGQIGNSGSIPWSYLDRVKQNALYKALKQMPEADAVLEPRYEYKTSSFLIFSTFTVKVTATGIKYQEGLVTK